MCDQMETNNWLWQPHKNGQIYIRVSYRTPHGEKKYLTRCLYSNNWPKARRIRDTEFIPIILDIEKARAQLDVILKTFPQLEKQLQHGVNGGYGESESETVDGSPTLQELLDIWEKELARENGNFQVGEKTARRYGKICGNFVLYTGGDKLLHKVTSRDVEAYRDSRLTEDGTAKKTVKLELTAIRSLFAYAKKQHGLESNPAEGVVVNMTRAERNREKRLKKRRPPTHAEADTLCRAFPGNHRRFAVEDFQDYAMFARYTGMRQGEIAHLEAEDFFTCKSDNYVDGILNHTAQYLKPYADTVPDDSVLCIYVRDTVERTTKTGNERLIPVADKLLPVVKRRIASSNGKAFFPFAVKDSGAAFGRTWLKRAKQVDSGLTMHGFRHYCTSEMENSGVHSSVSQIILGHEPATVHEGYFHKTVETLKNAVDKIY